MRRSGIICAALTILALVSRAGPGGAQDSVVMRADSLKAAYLVNFVKFVEWPAAVTTDVLTICFVGGEGVHDALASGIENKRVGARRLVVRQLSDAGAVAGCNVLYLDSAKLASGLPVSELPILTISDAKAFARNGGMIEVFTDSNRLRFNVNVDNAQRAGLRISSSLLQLAAAIEKGGGK